MSSKAKVKKTRKATVVVIPPPPAPKKRKRNRKNKAKGVVQTPPAISGSGAYKLAGTTSWDLPWWKGTVGGEISGSGSYAPVRKNTLMSMIDATGGPPRVVTTNQGEGFTICHREYLFDLKSGFFGVNPASTDYDQTVLRLNPANPTLFPFLSSIAGNFQEYMVNGMLVEFKTLSSNISTTLTLGSMFMSADYNVLAAPPIDKTHLENMENAGSCKPSNTLIMPIECARNQSVVKRLYVGPLEAEDGDLRLYDLCQIFIGSFDIPVENAAIAEVWITYDITFFKPKLLPVPANQTDFTWYYFGNDADGNTLLGTTTEQFPGNQTDLFAKLAAPIGFGRIRFPRQPGQTYLLLSYWVKDNDASDNNEPLPPQVGGAYISAMTAMTGPNNVLNSGRAFPESYNGLVGEPDAVGTALIVRIDPDIPIGAVPYVEYSGGNIWDLCSVGIVITIANKNNFKPDGNFVPAVLGSPGLVEAKPFFKAPSPKALDENKVPADSDILRHYERHLKGCDGDHKRAYYAYLDSVWSSGRSGKEIIPDQMLLFATYPELERGHLTQDPKRSQRDLVRTSTH